MEDRYGPPQIWPEEKIVRLFERLRQELPEYEFREDVAPFHSSYDNWHCFGRRKPAASADTRKKSAASASRPGSTKTRSEYDASESTTEDGEKEKELWVIARVSKHTLRLEREYKLCVSLSKESDPEYKHFVRPIQFTRLPLRQPGDMPLAVSMVEAPGRNYLRELVEFGPNFYATRPGAGPGKEAHGHVELLTFLDFAIGATECCEILHHGNEMVHGELRGDAFHYNKDTNTVRMINFGSGARSFEHGLTSAGWYVCFRFSISSSVIRVMHLPQSTAVYSNCESTGQRSCMCCCPKSRPTPKAACRYHGRTSSRLGRQLRSPWRR